MDDALRAHGLTKQFGEQYAVAGVEIRVPAGILRWAPPGMAAHAINAGPLGLLELAGLVATVAVLAWFWMNRLAHVLVTPDSSTHGRDPDVLDA